MSLGYCCLPVIGVSGILLNKVGVHQGLWIGPLDRRLGLIYRYIGSVFRIAVSPPPILKYGRSVLHSYNYSIRHLFHKKTRDCSCTAFLVLVAAWE